MTASVPNSSVAGAATQWRAFVTSARGASHVANGLANQDAVCTRDHGSVVVVAVADGHGHRRHFRSATGSALAVRCGVDAAEEFTPRLSVLTEAGDVDAAVVSALVPDIVARWRAALAADIAARPYSPEEQAALDSAGDGPEIPYGSTLLAVIISERWAACVQIGDGDIVAVGPDGRSSQPVPSDPFLDGYRTTSLCQPGATTLFRVGTVDLMATPLLGILLATDGYGNAQSADPWEPAVSADLAEAVRTYGVDWLSEQLPTWAHRCASSEGSGDDTTMALLMNIVVADARNDRS